MHAAQVRREQELRRLVLEGVPLCTLGKSGHWTIGPLHIYTAAGRWFSERTGRRGLLLGQSMRRLIEAEYRCSTLSTSMLRHGQQLCPEAAQETRRMAALYQQYDAFMTQATKHKTEYERFMSNARLSWPVKNTE